MPKPPLRATPWPPGEPGQKFRDDRLVWLAARPELVRMGKPWWLALVTMGSAGTRTHGLNHAAKKELGSARMRKLAVACDAVAARLSPAELATVRATGDLPPWFFDAIKAERDRR